jgi:hypothetical protein
MNNEVTIRTEDNETFRIPVSQIKAAKTKSDAPKVADEAKKPTVVAGKPASPKKAA